MPLNSPKLKNPGSSYPSLSVKLNDYLPNILKAHNKHPKDLKFISLRLSGKKSSTIDGESPEGKTESSID
jgi:hypothetical protein